MEVEHWETLVSDWAHHNPQVLWRLHSDSVNQSLLERWLPECEIGAILKTDLFDEAFGRGLMTPLVARARTVYGIDVARAVVAAARRREPKINGVRADVRKLPFSDGAFDAIVSISTLDHFRDRSDIDVAIAELHRALRPGGRLILTLDNAANPLVALRNALPFRTLHAIRLAPYFVGPTYGPRGLARALAAAGFRTLDATATLHCPRVFAVPIASLVQRHGGERAQRALARTLYGFERLSRWPTRYLTGHYVAVLAEKTAAATNGVPERVSAVSSSLP